MRHCGRLGFGGGAILVSLMIESLLLALAGGVIGAAAAYFAFNGVADVHDEFPELQPDHVRVPGDARVARARDYLGGGDRAVRRDFARDSGVPDRDRAGAARALIPSIYLMRSLRNRMTAPAQSPALCSPAELRLVFCSVLFQRSLRPKNIRTHMSDNKEKVTGIGGIFFRVQNPETMSAWYRDHLGISPRKATPYLTGAKAKAPISRAAPCGPSFRRHRILRPGPPRLHDQLSRRQLGENGRTTSRRRSDRREGEDYEYGKFAWITDPEGNRIELYEPKGK